MNVVAFFFVSVVALLQLLTFAEEANNKILCDFSNIKCKHAYDTRIKILQMFERVWQECPVVSALDRNIGYMERGYGTVQVIREHVRGFPWQKKFITGKSYDQQVNTLYDVYLNRKPSKDEREEYAQLIQAGKDYRWPENDIVMSPEFFNRVFMYNVVPGCGRPKVNCTWILDSITQSYCRLFHKCPDLIEYNEMGWMGGLGELATPLMIHRHYMQSQQYELLYMKGKPAAERLDKLFKHLLNRDRTPEENSVYLEKLAQNDYRNAVVVIQTLPEYQQKWGKWAIPGDDLNGGDIILDGLTFKPPCA